MANIITMDDDTLTTQALFGRPLQATQDYISNSVQNYVQSLGQGMSHMATDLLERFNNIRSKQTIQLVDNIRQRLNSVWETNGIRRLDTPLKVLSAPPIMHRWIMAEPALRASFNRGGCSGYDGAYVDVKPGGVGAKHYDYRRVMDGVVENGEYTNYREILITADDILSITDKAAIKATWNVIAGHVEETNMDPTDPWNSTLG